jgi:serine/threonine-protein kinase RsbW
MHFPEREVLAMGEMRSENRTPNTQSQFQGKPSVLEIDSWMPSKIQAISPLVDHLMGLIEGLQCIPGEEFGVELALREALENAVVHGNQENPERRVRIRCRCESGNELSIVVTDQGKGFDFETIARNGITWDPESEHGRGIQLMKVYMDDVHFERGGSEVHMRKRARTTCHS